MTENSDRTSTASFVDVAPHDGTAAVGLVCSEIWGGNRSFYGPIELPGLRGVLFSQASDGARGGDVHYLSVCGSGLISRVCLADVTGHGESVAAVSEAMHKLLRRSVNRMDERKVLRKLNLRLCQADYASFVTAGMLTYFPPTRRLSISHAGHEPAWYYEASQRRWSQLEPNPREGFFDMALAVAPSAKYTRRVTRVAVGNRLLIITDGVLEAPNEAGELFGRERLAGVLNAARGCGVDDVVAALLAALHEHTGGAPFQHDDVSALMIEFVENLRSSAFWTALRNRLLGWRRRRNLFKATLPASS